MHSCMIRLPWQQRQQQQQKKKHKKTHSITTMPTKRPSRKEGRKQQQTFELFEHAKQDAICVLPCYLTASYHKQPKAT